MPDFYSNLFLFHDSLKKAFPQILDKHFIFDDLSKIIDDNSFLYSESLFIKFCEIKNN